MQHDNFICPSAPAKEGALLLGVVNADKSVSLIAPQLLVDSQFLAIAKSSGSPEAKFRFASKCVKGGCSHWTGEKCGVINTLAAANPTVTGEPALKACSIRNACRWYAQEGARACVICTFVVTDNMRQNEVVSSPLASAENSRSK